MKAIINAVLTCGLVILMFAGNATIASDPVFQSFFFDACVNPVGDLATRCGETPDGSGDLSGNSETSLNPNQTVSSNQAPLANARNQISRAEDRLEGLSNEASVPSGDMVMVGPFSLLVNGSYTWFEQDESNRERGYDGDVYGIELGMDYRLSDRAVIGGFIGYENTDFDYDKDEAGRNFTPQGNSGTNEADTYSLVLLGSYQFTDQFYVEGSIGASMSEYEFERNVVFQESTRTVGQTNVRAKGDPDGDAYWASGSLGYAFNSGALSYTPYLNISYVRSEIDDYTEKDLNNSGLHMQVDNNNRDSVTARVGVRSSYAYGMDWGVLVPQVNLAYEHEFDEDAQTSTTAYVLDAGRNEYTIKGDGPDRDYFNAGVGVVGIFPNSWIAFLNYEGLFGYEDRERHQVVAGIRKEF